MTINQFYVENLISTMKKRVSFSLNFFLIFPVDGIYLVEPKTQDRLPQK